MLIVQLCALTLIGGMSLAQTRVGFTLGYESSQAVHHKAQVSPDGRTG